MAAASSEEWTIQEIEPEQIPHIRLKDVNHERLPAGGRGQYSHPVSPETPVIPSELFLFALI